MKSRNKKVSGAGGLKNIKTMFKKKGHFKHGTRNKFRVMTTLISAKKRFESSKKIVQNIFSGRIITDCLLTFELYCFSILFKVYFYILAYIYILWPKRKFENFSYSLLPSAGKFVKAGADIWGAEKIQ